MDISYVHSYVHWTFALVLDMYEIGRDFDFHRNQRLSKFSIDRNIIHPSQIGFQSGHRTADHIFTLKTIIDKRINQNKKEKLYACFVDFRKAFDSVWHEGLFLKLLENKIDGNFYNLVKSLYSNSKCAVKERKIELNFLLLHRSASRLCFEPSSI